MSRMKRLIDQNKKLFFSLVVLIIILPIIIFASFTSLTTQDRVSSVIISVVMLIFSFGGTLFVLGIQIWNPICPRKWLRNFCEFFIIFGIFGLLFGLFGQIQSFLKANWIINTNNYAIVGVIIAAYFIENRYCS